MENNKKIKKNVEAQHHDVASALSSIKGHGVVNAQRKRMRRRKSEITLVDSVINLTSVDASNKDCEKVSGSSLADILLAKGCKRKSLRRSRSAIFREIAGVVVYAASVAVVLKGMSFLENKK